ncbi:MAG: chemotaxis protein CheW [Leptospira sp.]|nr:chemotaxis protein CheW [Leptospira sp.]
MSLEKLKSKNDLDDDDDFYDEEEEDSLLDNYLIFKCDEKDYALEIRFVTEIVALQEITEIPDLPPYLKGIINLRGKVLPVLDVRSRFNMVETEYTERTCLVIAAKENSMIGLIVDAVTEVVKIPISEIEPPPKMNDKTSSRFVTGIGKAQEGVKIILNLHNLIYEEEVKRVDAHIKEMTTESTETP